MRGSEKKILFKEPVINEDNAVFHLMNVKTDLPSFRKYKSFDSSATLITSPKELDIRISLPANFDRLKYLSMDDPCRLVVRLYHPYAKEETGLHEGGVKR